MMGATSFVLLICSVVTLASACCTPDQWEGDEASIGGYASFWRHGLIREFIKVSYDAVNNRTAALLDYQNGKISSKFKIITRYDNDTSVGKLYVLDIKKGKCWTKTLKRPFRKACIPAEAKSVGNYSFGLSGALNATGYEIRGRRINAFVSVEEVGDNECVPISESVHGRLGKVDFIQSIGFINITPGINNETVFDIPEQCHKSEDTSLAEELTREHYIMAI